MRAPRMSKRCPAAHMAVRNTTWPIGLLRSAKSPRITSIQYYRHYSLHPKRAELGVRRPDHMSGTDTKKTQSYMQRHVLGTDTQVLRKRHAGSAQQPPESIYYYFCEHRELLWMAKRPKEGCSHFLVFSIRA